MSKNIITGSEYLTFEEVRDIFVRGEELNLHDPRHGALQAAFTDVCHSYLALKQQLHNAKSARGETVTQGQMGLVWQRNRAFLVTIVRLGLAKEEVAGHLAQLLTAYQNIDENGLALAVTDRLRCVVDSNLRCAYEIYEEASSLCIDAELFLAVAESIAWNDGAEGVKHLGRVPPGFNRNWVLKVSASDGEGAVRYTIGRIMHEQPPEGLRLSNFDVDKLIDIVGAREFKKGCGWIAVYRAERDHTGPKHYFQYGVRVQAQKTES